VIAREAPAQLHDMLFALALAAVVVLGGFAIV
jgi:hypothetical protein